jgi:hypothetical protein
VGTSKGQITAGITLAAGAVAAAGLALAPLASADPAPPVAAGNYNFHINDVVDGVSDAKVRVMYDCGPSCFSVANPQLKLSFTFDPATGNWHTPNGNTWTADGVNYDQASGSHGTLSPL